MKKRFMAMAMAAAMLVGLAACPVDASAKAKKIDIDDVNTYETIEADLNLTGKGTGYHGKLVFATYDAAISYGIQYDAHAVAPYTGKAMIMVENVTTNAAGGQQYYRPKDIEVKRGKTYHLMMTLTKKGKITCYFNNKKIATYTNKKLANTDVWPRVEGAARLNGDQVKAKFTNIDVRTNTITDIDAEEVTLTKFDVSPKIHSHIKNNHTITVSGKLAGLAAGQDWDSAYDQVSGTVQYYQYDYDN